MSNKKEVKVTNYSNGNGAKIDIYSPSSRANPHDTVHIKVNYENKSYTAITKVDGKKETSSGSCYLTTACMKHFNVEFDDNCYELQVLRWFRDNFVSIEDVNHYYKTAPAIVYERYKNSILLLEQQYAKSELGIRLIKCLKLKS